MEDAQTIQNLEQTQKPGVKGTTLAIGHQSDSIKLLLISSLIPLYTLNGLHQLIRIVYYCVYFLTDPNPNVDFKFANIFY